MKRIAAHQIATRFTQLIATGCETIEIAGSIRREKPEVHDIEIVAVPKLIEVQTYDLFGEVAEKQYESLLDTAIEMNLADKEFCYDIQVARNGQRYKRFIYKNIAVDLFIATPDNFGNILFIRTGDSAFSRLAVTERKSGGLMPSWLKHRDGRLWNGNTQVVCRTEQDFFDAIGIKFVDPKMRNEETVKQLKKEMTCQW